MTKKTRIRIVLKSGHVEEFDTDIFTVSTQGDQFVGYKYDGMEAEGKLMYVAFDEIALVRRVK